MPKGNITSVLDVSASGKLALIQLKVPARISGVSTKKFRSHAQNFFQKITKIFVPTKFFSTLPEAYIFFLIWAILSDFGQFDIPEFSLKWQKFFLEKILKNFSKN